MKKILLTAIVIVAAIYFGNIVMETVSAETTDLVDDIFSTEEVLYTPGINCHHHDDCEDIEWFDAIDDANSNDDMELELASYNIADSKPRSEIAINGKIFNVISQETDITGNEIYVCDNAVITVNYSTEHVAVTNEHGDVEIVDIENLLDL